METAEFNLLREQWIRVMRPDCQVEQLSLPDVLVRAREYRALAGELPTQDVAVLRLLLAVLHTVFSRVDEDGRAAPLETAGDARERWRSLWALKQFPERPIRDYLARWEDRFWLFHPEKPFYQVLAAEKGTEYGAAKLNGEMSESTHKTRLFPMRSGAEKKALDYAEAARWLVAINAFDDSSTKVGTGTGAGWPGRLGNLCAVGENLFETLMLNLTLLQDGRNVWEGENNPYWEQPMRVLLDKREIVQPDNQAELLTLQSRRLILKRENGKVVGYCTAGGDYFEDAMAFNEQLTLWYAPQVKKGQAPVYMPRRHDPSRQMWRDFGFLANMAPEAHKPGVVLWIGSMQQKGCMDRKTVRFQSVGARYDGKGSSVIDVFSDALDFHADLLDERAEDWVRMVQEVIKRCEDASSVVGRLADGLCKAAGGERDSEAQYAKEQYFYRLDLPFRQWLLSLDPEAEGVERETARADAERVMKKTAYDIARQLGAQMVAQAGVAAFAGRTLMEGPPGKKEPRRYTSPEAYNNFLYWIRQCFEIKAVKEALNG